MGSTGSGKSNAVGVVLEAIERKELTNSRILLIDPHGEYNSVFRHNSIIFKTHANVAERDLGFLDNMRSKMKDSRYKFLFEPGEYSPDLEGKTVKGLSDLLNFWLGNIGKITILDFSDIPSEIMISTAGTLLNIIYDALFWGQNLSVGGKQ